MPRGQGRGGCGDKRIMASGISSFLARLLRRPSDTGGEAPLLDQVTSQQLLRLAAERPPDEPAADGPAAERYQPLHGPPAEGDGEPATL